MIQTFQLKKTKISNGRFLEFKCEDIPIKSPLILPFGSIYGEEKKKEEDRHELFLETTHNRLSRLIATRDLNQENTIQILPTYSSTNEITHERLKERKIKFDFWVIERDVEHIEAQEIIRRSHYLDIPRYGLYLGCRFTDPKEQSGFLNAIKRMKNREDKWSAAWTKKPGNMIGCAVLSTLEHGNPNGRIAIAKRLQRTDIVDNWETLKRPEIIRKLGIAWISRIAIDVPYRGFGLGTHLVNHLAQIAMKHRVPKASAIEVMRTVPSIDADLLIARNNDFLTRGGYTLFNEKSSSKPLLITNKENGDRIKPGVTAKKLYYYKIL